MSEDTSYTPAEIEAMRHTVEEYDAEQAVAAAAAEAARLLPLRTFTNSDAYAAMLDGLDDIVSVYGEDPNFGPHIQCLKVGLPALKAAAGPIPEAPADGE